MPSAVFIACILRYISEEIPAPFPSLEKRELYALSHNFNHLLMVSFHVLHEFDLISCAVQIIHWMSDLIVMSPSR